MPYFRYVPSDEFTPESRINWLTLGKVEKWTHEKEGQVDRLSLYLEGNHKVYIYILSPASFRIRFNPNPEAPFVKNRSPATIVDIAIFLLLLFLLLAKHLCFFMSQSRQLVWLHVMFGISSGKMHQPESLRDPMPLLG